MICTNCDLHENITNLISLICLISNQYVATPQQLLCHLACVHNTQSSEHHLRHHTVTDTTLISELSMSSIFLISIKSTHLFDIQYSHSHQLPFDLKTDVTYITSCMRHLTNSYQQMPPYLEIQIQLLLRPSFRIASSTQTPPASVSYHAISTDFLRPEASRLVTTHDATKVTRLLNIIDVRISAYMLYILILNTRSKSIIFLL